MTAPALGGQAGEPVCRSCAGTGLEVFLSLGDQPLPDDFVPAHALEEGDERYPLDVAFCPACCLVQLVGDVSAERMFVDNYLYFSSFSDHLLAHSREHALQLIETRKLGPRSLVVELASNDGYLLRNFLEVGVPAVGVDPSPGPVAAAREVGVETIKAFFGRDVARRLVAERGRADVVVANNVMAHVPDLDDFVGGIAELLAEDGIVTVENAYVRDLIDHREFDTIYHEHVCYYSCTSVDRLVRPHGLHLNDVASFPDLHGGTLRWYLSRQPGRTERLESYLQEEERCGLNEADYYRTFARDVESLRHELLSLLQSLRDDGHSLAAYGAAAKGTIMLNYVGIGPELVDFVVDRNVHKHGRYMPGVRIPIVEPERLLEASPDYTLLLAWNFTAEIVQQQAAYLEAGGRFIRPVPSPVVLEPSRSS
ncbi:MAG: class I SAM-dependent methyltransferase [Nitriliruptor sp.]|nr:MAG: class I SAM-dependent methyltransferase [Nitriliruptor sp.]